MNKNFTKTLFSFLALGFVTVAQAQITTSAFALATKLSPGSTIKGCVMADFDGDGKKDIAFSNGAVTGNIFVFPGKNVISGVIDSSTFGPMLTFDALTTPAVMDAADVDRDGKLDLIVGHWNTDQVSVFSNTSTSGNISFSTRTDFSAGAAYPSEVKVADLDGDTLPDIVISCFQSQEAFVLQNATTGSSVVFVPVNSITLAGVYPGASVIRDFDKDGKNDIAFTLYDDTVNAVQFFRNTSTTGNIDFTSAAKISVGTLPQNIDAGDINKDGKVDVVVLNSTSSTLSVLENGSTSGTISFNTPVTLSLTSYGTLTGCAIKDVTGDGYGDIAACGTTGSQFGIFVHKGTAGAISTNSFYSKVDFTLAASPANIWISDFDGDNRADLVVASDNDAYVFHNNFIPVGVPFINGVKEMMHVYPNPVKDLFTVELPSGVTQAQVKLFDVTGKSFGSYDYQQGQKLDLSSLGKGIYILRITAGTETYSGKLVKE